MFLKLNRPRPFRAHSRRPTFRPGLERLESRDTPSTTLLTVTPNPATVGQTVTLTATMTESLGDLVQPGTGINPGKVNFMDGSATLMTVTVTPKAGTTTQGVASFTTSALSAGAHSLTAGYNGDYLLGVGTFSSTSNAVMETINAPAPPPTTPALVNVSASVTLTPVKPKMHHHANPLRREFTLQDHGAAVAGPVFVVVRSLAPKVTLKNASGKTTNQGTIGDPFVRLDVSLLTAGRDLDVVLAFANPKHKHFHFTTEVFAGPGSP
jgi:hypothetical protein